jgi:hypothetical protein
VSPRPFARIVLVAAPTVAAVIAGLLGACVGSDPSGAPVDTTTESGAETSTDDASVGDGAVDGMPSSMDASDADAGTWTPALLDQADNLALWLEPSGSALVISSGTIGIWKDRSKHHTDAKNPTAGPTIHAGILNGHDTVHFDTNVVLSIDDAPSLRFGTAQVYIAAVARLIPSNGSGFIFAKTTSMFSTGGPVYSGGFELWAGPGTTDAGVSALFPSARVAPGIGNGNDWGDAVFDDSRFHFVAARRINGSSLALTVDDQPDRVAPIGSFDADEVGRPVVLGAFRYGSFNPPVDFDIAEIIVVHGPTDIVSDADVANVHAYLKKKYAL